ncbi:ALF repeat-containing protein [Streptomyces californicus]|uniref:ALF repeat-containing protein n=1 Tax=Streptomyces californicus TaxID=67351 RepID=UPI0036CB3F79
MTVGRKAAARLLDSSGTWTRGAAEFALSGSDHDVANWIDADRVLAQQQDDQENVLALAQASTAGVAEAAERALADSDPNAATAFLETGAVEAAAVDNRVMVFKILAQDPGRAVKAKAQAALDAGTAKALHHFLTIELTAATKEDDQVEVFRLLETGGPYMQSAARIVLEGSARMRRAFVVRDKFDIARLDHDHATHISAIRATLAHAAKVAAKALEDAARASKAAADARQASKEATEWAAKADGYAADARGAADQAKANADAADRSAASAAQSAKDASAAALTARGAARSANYSMRQASSSARQAVAFAVDAQASASRAAADAQRAGQDAAAAAQAASQAHAIAAQKRRAEAATAAKKAAEVARKHQQDGTNPSDKPENDDTGDTKWLDMWPEDMKDAKDWASATGHWSTLFGTAAVVLGVAALFPTPASPVLGGLAFGAGLISWGLQGVSAGLAGWGYGWDSSEFHQALGLFVVGGVFFGKGRLFSKFGMAEEIGAKVSGVIGDTATTIIGRITW